MEVVCAKKLVTVLVTVTQKLGTILWKITAIFIKNPPLSIKNGLILGDGEVPFFCTIVYKVLYIKGFFVYWATLQLGRNIYIHQLLFAYK